VEGEEDPCIGKCESESEQGAEGDEEGRVQESLSLLSAKVVHSHPYSVAARLSRCRRWFSLRGRRRAYGSVGGREGRVCSSVAVIGLGPHSPTG
jgi:hypothetical protein